MATFSNQKTEQFNADAQSSEPAEFMVQEMERKLEQSFNQRLREIGIRLVRILKRVYPQTEYYNEGQHEYSVSFVKDLIAELDYRVSENQQQRASPAMPYPFPAYQSSGPNFYSPSGSMEHHISQEQELKD